MATHKSKQNFSGLEIMVERNIERWIIIPDVHLTDKTPAPYQLIKKIIKNNKFNGAILLGDYMDIAALSEWDKDKRQLMENQRYEKEIDNANSELDFLQKYIDRIVYIEGNHESRIGRYIEKNPELQGLLEIQKVLDLEKRGIDWVPINQLLKMGHCYFTHGMFTGKYHASQHLATLGCNIVYGHKHQPQMCMTNMKMQKPIVAQGLGCLCDLNQPYLRGLPPNWLNQAGYIDIDKQTGSFNLNVINIILGECIYNGKKYK